MAKGRKPKAEVKPQAKGLGDTVESIIKLTGLDIFVKGKDCGCEKRKEWLNELGEKIFPSRFVPRCFTEDEYIGWKNFRERRSADKIMANEVDYICRLFANVFNRRYYRPCSGCSPKPLIDMIDKLDLVFESYGK
jgi:hypothetical protein